MPVPKISIDDFVRRFAMRASNLMWFLGAGASASAGIPTAADMVWEFKRLLFITQRKASSRSVSDLADLAVRLRIQDFVDGLAGASAAGAQDEYASLFEIAYPAEADRRTYIDAKVKGGKPSYGHIALATLMRASLARIVWTTNFDTLVADACAKVYDGTGHLTTVALDTPDLAKQVIAEQRWPVEVKIHGDFRSRRLKNTSEELRLQDEKLRRILVDSCRRFGLIVVGYSGRDSSVMDAFEEALASPGAYPSGLFWLHRGEGEPNERVLQLIERASAGGVEATLVRMENFDETLRDIVRVQTDLDTSVLNQFAIERQRRSPAPGPRRGKGWPILRFNAIPILQSPSVCRLIDCGVGGYADARGAVEASGVDILVARTKAGVLGFGSDRDMHLAFDRYEIRQFGLHTIETKRLRYDSGERGLLRKALTRAFTRQRVVSALSRQSSDLLFPTDSDASIWHPLQRLVNSLSGPVPGFPGLRWFEGLGVRLEWADDRLWLLFEPRTVFEGITGENKAAAADFARERTVRRYNRSLNDLIAFWAAYLSENGAELRALGISDGVDAVFRLGTDTAYSRRSS